jgi:hypothetical protein
VTHPLIRRAGTAVLGGALLAATLTSLATTPAYAADL